MRGWIIIISSFVVTLFFWLLAKSVRPMGSIEQSLAQILGLLGIMSLCWTFILAIRHKSIENIFGGLDKVYKIHHILGGLTFVALANHVAFLIMAAYPLNQAKLYLLPGKILSYNLGQIAFYIMLFLLALTLYVNLPYRFWKWTHEWMGLVIIFGGIHSLIGTTDTTSFPLLGWWIGMWSVIATIAFLYKRYGYYYLVKPVVYKLSLSGADGDLQVLSLQAQDKRIDFAPGQYGFFSLPIRPRDEHAFSILNQEGEKLYIGIKVHNNFTADLRNLKQGDEIFIRGPFGKFAEKINEAKHMVWIAGGIGITPFLTMAKALSADKKVEMYYCASVMPNPVFTDPFVNLATNSSNFTWIPCETKRSGRLTGEQIYVQAGSDKEAFYFLCGPKIMMESLANDLAGRGIKRSHIIYEDFAFK